GAFQADPLSDVPGVVDTADGSTYVLFGGLASLQALDALDGTVDGKIDLHRVDGTTGFRIDGAVLNDRSGHSVSFAGDFNGDGIADLLVGALGFDDAGANTNDGAAYVVFGKTNWSGTPVVSLASINGTNGVRFNGAGIGDLTGFSVSGAGDVNGDGFDDIIIGAYLAPNGSGTGRAYVVFGKADWAATGSAGFNESSLNGTNGFTVNGF